MNNILFVIRVKILSFLNDHAIPPIILTIEEKQLNYFKQITIFVNLRLSLVLN